MLQGMFIVSLPFAVLRGGYWAIAAMVGIAHICCYTGINNSIRLLIKN